MNKKKNTKNSFGENTSSPVPKKRKKKEKNISSQASVDSSDNILDDGSESSVEEKVIPVTVTPVIISAQEDEGVHVEEEEISDPLFNDNGELPEPDQPVVEGLNIEKEEDDLTMGSFSFPSSENEKIKYSFLGNIIYNICSFFSKLKNKIIAFWKKYIGGLNSSQ